LDDAQEAEMAGLPNELCVIRVQVKEIDGDIVIKVARWIEALSLET